MSIKKIIFPLLLLTTIFSNPAKADSPLSFDLCTAFSTDYMFRGQNLYDGTSIQPYGNLIYDTGYGKLTASLWMHLSAEGDRQAEKFTEMDETIFYSVNLTDEVGVKLGHIWYTYPDDNDEINDTNELFVGVSLNDTELSPFPLNPSLTVYKDYRATEYWYYELGFSHEVECKCLGDGFKFTPFATFGFASNAEKVYSDDGLEHVNIGSSFPTKLGDIAIIPTVSYNFKVDDNTTNEFWFITHFMFSL